MCARVVGLDYDGLRSWIVEVDCDCGLRRWVVEKGCRNVVDVAQVACPKQIRCLFVGVGII